MNHSSLATHKLTVIILSINRPVALAQGVNYLLGSTNYNIVVLDASTTFCVKLHILSNAKLTYLHRPSMTPVDRLLEAREYIKTPYVQLKPDDDPMIHMTTEACISFLENEPLYSSCIGRCYAFRTYTFLGLRFLPEYTSNDYVSVESKSRFDRITQSIVNYSPTTIYSIQRVEVFNIWVGAMARTISHFGVSLNPYVSEHMHSITTHLIGASKVLPLPHWLRCEDNEPITLQFASRLISFHQWLYSQPLNHKFIASFLVEQYTTSISPNGSNPNPLRLIKCITESLDIYKLKKLTQSNSTIASKLRIMLNIEYSFAPLEKVLDLMRNIKRNLLFNLRMLSIGKSFESIFGTQNHHFQTRSLKFKIFNF